MHRCMTEVLIKRARSRLPQLIDITNERQLDYSAFQTTSH
jgi:hypothetical protein